MNRIAAGLLLVAALFPAALSGCTKPQCAHDDMDCFLRSMVLADPKGGGAMLSLVAVDGSKLVSKGSGGGGGAAGCGAGLSSCLGACVDTRTDARNCGACGTVCSTDTSCTNGGCVGPPPACPAGLLQCAGGACVSPMIDPQNCGACGHSCYGALCQQGVCVGACSPGMAQCGQGCTRTQTDPQNCGGCGNACPIPGEPCVNGSCGGCVPGDAWCPGTGCTDTSGDPQNCGGCGKACSPGQICATAICQCPDNQPTCNPALSGPPPAITNQPDPVEYFDPETLEPIELDFTDPNGCTPAFCGHLCSGKSNCSAGFMCAKPVRDHQTSGVWKSYLGFLAEASDEQATFTTGVVPVSAPGCDDGLIDQLAAGNDVAIDVGAEVEIDVTVDTADSSSSSSGSGSGSGSGVGTTCSGQASTCDCSVKACTSSATDCWYETSNGTFTCSGCNCQAAAQAVVASCCPKP
jgi:hypothetical protein